jgi:hypothetical protein
MAIRRLPVTASTLGVGSATRRTLASCTIFVAAGVFTPDAHLRPDQFLYIYSSIAQVIAALYGLTVTGYIFFRNQQDPIEERDESLTEILGRIQERQYQFIKFLTLLSLSSILLAILAIAMMEVKTFPPPFLVSSTAAAAFIASIYWTGYFVTDALRPGQIERVSQAIKQELEPARSPAASIPGAFERFMVEFKRLESELNAFAERHLMFSGGITATSQAEFQRRPVNKNSWTKPRIVRALMDQEIVDRELGELLIMQIRYRNALVHGEDMFVPEEAVIQLKESTSRLIDQMADFNSKL